MAESMRQELRHCLQTRITVFWRCDGTTACSTGILIQVGFDFIELVGIVPTFAEDEATFPVTCQDPQGLLLQTVIPLKSVCAFVEGVPAGRKVTIPLCCQSPDGQV